MKKLALSVLSAGALFFAACNSATSESDSHSHEGHDHIQGHDHMVGERIDAALDSLEETGDTLEQRAETKEGIKAGVRSAKEEVKEASKAAATDIKNAAKKVGNELDQAAKEVKEDLKKKD